MRQGPGVRHTPGCQILPPLLLYAERLKPGLPDAKLTGVGRLAPEVVGCGVHVLKAVFTSPAQAPLTLMRGPCALADTLADSASSQD